MNRVRTEIRLVSDSMDVDGWQQVPPNAIYSNDYYAIVMDDFEVVSTLDSPFAFHSAQCHSSVPFAFRIVSQNYVRIFAESVIQPGRQIHHIVREFVQRGKNGECRNFCVQLVPFDVRSLECGPCGAIVCD